MYKVHGPKDKRWPDQWWNTVKEAGVAGVDNGGGEKKIGEFIGNSRWE